MLPVFQGWATKGHVTVPLRMETFSLGILTATLQSPPTLRLPYCQEEWDDGKGQGPGLACLFSDVGDHLDL